MARLLYIKVRYKVCQWLVAGLWIFLGSPVSSADKADRHDITEILLKVALNTITLILTKSSSGCQIHIQCTV